MAYHKGDISIEKTWCDANEDGGYDWPDKRTVILLPHSCEDWVIGGVEEAQQMIADLQEAIKNFPK